MAKTSYLVSDDPAAKPITALTRDTFDAWLKAQSAERRRWVTQSGFKANPGSFCLLPGPQGELEEVLLLVDAQEPTWSYGALPTALPPGSYYLSQALRPTAASAAALGWWLGTYNFARYKTNGRDYARLVWPKAADQDLVTHTAEAIFLTRDLINTPANDMGPTALAEAAKALAKRHRAKCSVIVGDALLRKNYPAIHAVGRASDDDPRLIDLRWGTRGPKVTLVGKGVCFDSGGLDLKPASGMKMMKKDMGGAAHVLGLAALIMAQKLPLRLRVLVPAVENAVSGNAFRPLDVLQTRKGLTVEVGNTDAEGRLVLCDALAEADSEKPDLLVDFATLTGAARVALGTDLPAFFSNDDKLAGAVLRQGTVEGDPVWRLPLHQPYRQGLESKVADLNNISNSPYGGAIVAALFLEQFVSPTTRWAHFDIMAWNLAGRPGRPEGGEAMGLRAVYAVIAELIRRAPSRKR
ncbi:leucyl aminopeptidase family protein [Pelagibius litoralis]|uniref:leucyl aminopeptidase family protein n=1 Tax=Pelagibius litoralis TaxID=374515 RepID=UPI001F0CF695|nr:leucyl aminopeptidase family protein [Pelagibius litoralis]